MKKDDHIKTKAQIISNVEKIDEFKLNSFDAILPQEISNNNNM